MQLYPDFKLWRQLDVSNKFNFIYNREGHAYFTSKNLPNDMMFIKSNLFEVKFYCSDFITQNVNYALSTKPLEFSCTHLQNTIKYPKLTFYIYKVD
jgi:hypothetical protein